MHSKWLSFLDVVTEKLNATVEYNFIEPEIMLRYEEHYTIVENISANGTLDFYLDLGPYIRGALYSYNQMDYCYLLAKPPSYSVTQLVLILPFDK